MCCGRIALKIRGHLTIACLLFGRFSIAADAILLEPTELETWVHQDGTSIVFEESVGRMIDGDSVALFSALKLAIPLHPPGEIAGARIDIQDKAFTDTVYLEPSRLDAMVRQIEGMHKHSLAMLAQRQAPSQTHGMEECIQTRTRHTAIHLLCIQFTVSAEEEWLSFYSFRGHSIRFPGRRPVELLDMLRGIVAALDQ